MTKSVSFLFLLLSLFTLLLSGCGQQYANTTAPKAVDGILDLSGWDFEKSGPIKLEGEWEFYWKQLLEPKDFPHLTNPR